MTKSWSRRAFAAGLGAAAIAGAAVAGNFVAAQDNSPQSANEPALAVEDYFEVEGGEGLAISIGDPAQMQQRMDEYLNRLAQNLGIDATRLRDAIKQTTIQEVDRAFTEGRLTAQQAQQLKDRINSGQGVPFFGPFMFGPAKAGAPGAFGRVERAVGGPFGNHQQLAQFLGITTEQLRTALRTQSLAQVAQANGKSADQLKQFMTSSMQQSLAQAVSAGRITQQQADQRLANYQSRLDQLINAVGKGGPRGGLRAPRAVPSQ